MRFYSRDCVPGYIIVACNLSNARRYASLRIARSVSSKVQFLQSIVYKLNTAINTAVAAIHKESEVERNPYCILCHCVVGPRPKRALPGIHYCLKFILATWRLHKYTRTRARILYIASRLGY